MTKQRVDDENPDIGTSSFGGVGGGGSAAICGEVGCLANLESCGSYVFMWIRQGRLLRACDPRGVETFYDLPIMQAIQ